MTDVRMLGPLEVGPRAAPQTVAAGKQRAVLVALALNAGTPVSTALLSEVVWGEDLPASAAKLLQVYVSQLRKLLPPSVPLSTRPPGYCLEISPARVDALLFADLVEAARRARGEGDVDEATDLLMHARDLWRGEALVDVPPALLFDKEAERLAALRLDALEELLALRLERGEAMHVLADLEDLTRSHPFREGLHASLVLALYRSGRQGEALAAYDALRSRLVEDLAVEPGAALRELHLRILRHDPTLDVAGAIDALPVPLTRTVGRETELSALEALLADPSRRLVTLTGTGGSGKTRLSLVAADRVRGRFPGGIAQVPLEAVRDAALAMTAIAAALGVRETGEDPITVMAATLSHRRRVLLVLDNLEQVVAVGPALGVLLARLPSLTLLVTSRVLLGVAGEQAFPVLPLELPAAGYPSLAEVQRSAAVALYCERARAALPSFVLDADNAAPVAELCRRLDGLPLAVELAAAQSRTMSPAELLTRWTTRLDAPGASAPDRPVRHRSLRSALNGSWELLSTPGRELLPAVSVFVGSFDLVAAETVCGATPQVIGELVDHSLLQVRNGPGHRFVMLETVREFAAERGTDSSLRVRHAAYFLSLAEEARTELAGTAQAFRLTQLDSEQDNLRAAFATFKEVGDVDAELRLAVALARYWYVRGHLSESRSRLSDALSRAATLAPQLRGDALRKVSANAVLRGDYDEALAFAEQAIALYDEAGDRLGRARSLSNIGAACHASGDWTRAAISLDEALLIARELGAERVVALALNNRGDLCLTLGEHTRASALFEESHALLVTLGDDLNIARSLLNRALSALGRDLLDDAAALVARSLELSVRLNDTEDIAWGLLARSAVLARTDQAELAAVLLGAAEARLTEIEAVLKPYERTLYNATSALLDGALGDVGLYDARARGSRLSVQEAVASALA